MKQRRNSKLGAWKDGRTHTFPLSGVEMYEVNCRGKAESEDFHEETEF